MNHIIWRTNTSNIQILDVLGQFCGRKYVRFDLIWNPAIDVNIVQAGSAVNDSHDELSYMVKDTSTDSQFSPCM